MRTGHLIERAEIAIAIKLLFDSTSEWFQHGQIVRHCEEMMGYRPHDDCVREVLVRMIANANAEISTRKGNYIYRRTTAMWSSRMVHKIYARRK